MHRREIDGLELACSSSVPDLDDPCGVNFCYRDLIECGETQAATEMMNIPKQAASFNALYDLAVNVLDPVIDYYRMIQLTYGFCSQESMRRLVIPNPLIDETELIYGDSEARTMTSARIVFTPFHRSWE